MRIQIKLVINNLWLLIIYCKQKTQERIPEFNAGGRGRTGTILLPRDFKSRASANSATPADG